MSRPGSPQGPCTPPVAASGKSSPTTTWSIRTALSPAGQLSQTVVVLSWRRAPSTPSLSLMDAPAGDPTRGVPARGAVNQTGAMMWARQTAASSKGNPKGVMCAASAASLTPRPQI